MKLFLIRHCQATGQEPFAQLTATGMKQAKDLAEFLSTYSIRRVISSPYSRAIQTITPFANKQHLLIEIDERLKERVLSEEPLPDWLEKLKQSFKDDEIKFPGGESSKEASERILAVVTDIFNSTDENVAIITHGNLLSLLLNQLSQNFGFEEWQQLSNPDVYIIEKQNDQLIYKRIWK